MADLEELFRKQLNNPDEAMGQQYSYLRDMNRTPSMELAMDLPEGHHGNYQGWENRIKVNPFSFINLDCSQSAVKRLYNRNCQKSHNCP